MKKMIIKMIPDIAWDYYRRYKYNSERKRKLKEVKTIFTEIYDENYWNSKDSFSGTGSDNKQTESIRIQIPEVIKKFSIKTILDIPCGDFNWMRHVDLSNVQYLGADIVEQMIERNNELHRSASVGFKVLNLLEDNLPKVDLILCRDCLVHFSYENINKALKNICSSRSEFLLTTSFVKRRLNFDIETGDWRPINLSIDPFNWPKPQHVIIENCTEGNGKSYDKALVLYKISDLLNVVK
jgi:hypothetical protein